MQAGVHGPLTRCQGYRGHEVLAGEARAPSRQRDVLRDGAATVLIARARRRVCRRVPLCHDAGKYSEMGVASSFRYPFLSYDMRGKR